MKYQLLDSGGEQKLEQFGNYTLVRPCSQAVWKPLLAPSVWKGAHARFTREPANRWTSTSPLPQKWVIEHGGVQFTLMPTDFGHVGVFPEHALLWDWMSHRLTKKSRLLNLFAYTGGATLTAAMLGAEVCHVDASKVAVAWARENAALNRLEKARVRWIVDDVIKFLKREVRRGQLYDGVVIDPPTFGRGSQGEVFQIGEHLPEILGASFSLLAKGASFVILSCHTPGYTPLVLHHLLQEASQKKEGRIEMGELTIPGPLELTSGSYARWYAS